ncbi:hypothetical protein IAD21_01146 [Abditibacteriota bacterium]|nr:hypothetical protein IAD21_01146 [Abditibacteriota bacterium]
MDKRIIGLAWGLMAGALLGGAAGMFWFFLPGMMLGGLCGALIGAITPPRVGGAMLLSYVMVTPVSLVGLLRWLNNREYRAWMEAPVGGGHYGISDSFLAWPLSILGGLVAAAVVGVVIARPWQRQGQRLLGWVGVVAAVLPLLIPGAGAGWLLSVAREGQAIGWADDDRRDAQRVAEAQKVEREKSRLRTSAKLLVGALGELQYPGATPAVISSDGMSFTCDTNDSIPTVVAYYERLIGHRFVMRPASDGGTSAFYSDVIKLKDAHEIYVYIQLPTSPSVPAHITLAPV